MNRSENEKTLVIVYVMKGWPSPATTLVILGMFFVAVEAVKLYWVPLQALSEFVVKKKQATANRFYIGAFVVIACAILLRQCGF